MVAAVGPEDALVACVSCLTAAVLLVAGIDKLARAGGCQSSARSPAVTTTPTAMARRMGARRR